ncbi:Endo-1,4-beta-xylanase A precursor [compost metagenome]
MNRTEMVLMLLRAYVYSGQKLQQPSGNPTDFQDAAAIPDWATTQVEAAVAAGLVNGDNNGLFRPAAEATRAEAVTVLIRLLNLQDQ